MSKDFRGAKGAQQPPLFGPCTFWPNGLMDQYATWYGGRPQPRHIILEEDPASSSRKGHCGLHLSAHVYCGQTAAWIKMTIIGTVVGRDPGNIMLDGDAAPPKE